MPDEEPNTELALQFAHVLRERWLREMDSFRRTAEALGLRPAEKDLELADRHRAFPIDPITTTYWTLYDARRYDKRQEVSNDFPSVPLAQDRLRQLPARLKRRSQLRCGGSTARHRAVPRGGRAEEHADHAHFRDARPGGSCLGSSASGADDWGEDSDAPGGRRAFWLRAASGRGGARGRKRQGHRPGHTWPYTGQRVANRHRSLACEGTVVRADGRHALLGRCRSAGPAGRGCRGGIG